MTAPGFNGGLDMQRSYYAATANASPPTERFVGKAEVDVVVVGGGCTGLAAARALARRGSAVILLEGGRIGWGASGRNGGQIIPGLRLGAVELVRSYGREHARRLFDLAVSARDEVVRLIEDEQIECDLKTTGHLSAAIRRGDVEHMKREVDCLVTQMEYGNAEILDASQVSREVASDYVGGLLDRSGGHLHPLNYTLGLARAAQRDGAALFTDSPALAIEEERDAVTVRLASGSIRAKRCVLAGDALLGSVDPDLDRHIMPVANYIVATRPLEGASLIPNDCAVSDSRFVVNYFRMSADGRLVFGGGERYSTRPPRDLAAFVRPFMARTFPQLSEVPIDYAWGGLVSVTRTRLPHIGRRGPVLWGHGYSGMGTILSSLAGRVIAQAIAGDERDIDLFASVAPPSFPGGAALRGPLHVLAMLWFAGRDRFGL